MYLAKIVSVKPAERKREKGSVLVANFCIEIQDVIKVNGEDPDQNQKEQIEGSKIFDDFPLPAEGEPGGIRKRRLIFFKRLGLIAETGGSITKETFQAAVGKETVITVEAQVVQNKTYNKIAFAGYENPETYFGGQQPAGGSNRANKNAEKFDDI
ncbi:MAG: hypothetical protein HQK59_01760 [Deltaproteobacteria bacterium]|nr:hypothetical protein [Deltaproteobacteria bacterium]